MNELEANIPVRKGILKPLFFCSTKVCLVPVHWPCLNTTAEKQDNLQDNGSLIVSIDSGVPEALVHIMSHTADRFLARCLLSVSIV